MLHGLVSGGAALAMVATAWTLARDFAPATAQAQPAVLGPLPETGRWMSFGNGDRVQRIARDGGTAWVASQGGGVVRWDIETATYRQYLAPQDGLLSNRVSDVEVGPDGVVWAATARGLARLRPGEERWETITPQSSPDMPARMVTAVEPTDDGNVWVGFAQEWNPELLNPKTRSNGNFNGGGIARFNPTANAWDKKVRPQIERTSDGEVFKTIPSENVTELELSTTGLLWIGTRPYYVFDENACGDSECLAAPGYWVWAGGGMAAFDGTKWQVWQSTVGGGCFSDQITDMVADQKGMMWVGTVGRGLLLMRFGIQKTSCNSGQSCFTRGRKSDGVPRGLLGNTVWSVDLDAEGRVWVGHSDGYDEGKGIAVLDHNGTYEAPCDDEYGLRSDDIWEYIDFDDIPGDSTNMITAISAGAEPKLVGTRDHKWGGGEGLRKIVQPDGGPRRWDPMRTADTGLPSNQITDIAHNPSTGETWVSTADRGVARFDGRTWQSWRMFGRGQQVALCTQDTRDGYDRFRVNIADQAAFNQIFPVLPTYLRIEGDPNFYKVTGYTPERAGVGPFIKIQPKLLRPVAKGAALYSVYRGPPSDTGTQIALDAAGLPWAGGRETIWTGNSGCPIKKLNLAQCWLDGGVGHFDGRAWSVFDVDNSPLFSQEIQAVAVDATGRVWAGTGNGKSEGYGIGVYDPAAKTWVEYERASLPQGQKMGGNGVNDFSIDPTTNHVWVAHHPVAEWYQVHTSVTRVFVGGGVSRWDGNAWQAWTKRSGARIRAFGDDGDITAVLADRIHNRVWAGGWEGDPNFHWLDGYGVHASVNWCPLDRCGNDDWESVLFREDGKVSDIDLDQAGNVWVATHRNGVGKVPPIGGIKVFDGANWSTYTPDNVPLVSNQVTTLAPAGDEMWIGSLADGISMFDAIPPAPPTETPTATPSVTPTPIAPTATATSPGDDTPTPGSPTAATQAATPTPTRTPVPPTPPTATTGVPTVPIAAACGIGTQRVCRIMLPYANSRRACTGRCPTAPPRGPTAALFTATPPGTPASPTHPPASPTSAPTQTSGPRPSATATDAVPATERATRTSTEAPPATTTPPPTQPAATATFTVTPSRTPTATATRPTSTPTRTAPPPTPTRPTVREWSVYSPTDFRLPTDDFHGVSGTASNNVWFVGARGQVLQWDGSKMSSVSVPSQEVLRQVQMVSATQGFIAGDNGTLLEMRSRRWIKSDTGTLSDNWKAVAAVQGDDGLTGWLLGDDKGHRLRLGGGAWAPGGPADRNTGHSYSAVAMLGPTSAFATQAGAQGSRIYRWSGGDWLPGPATGALYDLQVRSTTQGIAVGARGVVFELNEAGEWKAMASKPSTGGQDLRAVHWVAPDLVWAGGGRGGLYRYTGSSWTASDVRTQNRTIYDIWIAADGSQGWAVGEGGLFLRYE